MRKDTLYVSDLDGTLFDDTSHISQATACMLGEAISSGAMFTVATARTPATVQNLLRSIPMARYTDPHTGQKLTLPWIVMTGSALWDKDQARFTKVNLIPEDEAVKLRGSFASAGLNPFIYCLSGDSFLNVYHTRAMNSREESFFNDRRHLTLKRFHLDQMPADLSHVVLFFAIGPEEAVSKASDELHGVSKCAVAWYRDVITPQTGLIDIYAPGVSKAEAVRRMAERCGARRIVVFGDNLNDLPMMEVADVSVAVANAFPQVLERADIVIGRNTEHAVARYILDDK